MGNSSVTTSFSPLTTIKSSEVNTNFSDISDNIDQWGNFHGMKRQAIINAGFDVWQRGTSFTDPSDGDYTADRWKWNQNLDGGTNPTVTVSRQTHPGNIFHSYYHYRVNVTGAGSGYGANAEITASQRIEHGTRFLCGANKTVRVSMIAKSSIANKRFGFYLRQNYGTGGSPSSEEVITGGKATLTSSWVTYSMTFTTNTLSGKTFGTNDDDYLELLIGFVWGTTTDANFGATTAEDFGGSGNIEIAQVQVTSDQVSRLWMPRSVEEEKLLCFRYYNRVDNGVAAGLGAAVTTTVALCGVVMPVPMRIVPNIKTSAVTDAQLSDHSTSIQTTDMTFHAMSTNKLVMVRPVVASGLTAFRPYWLEILSGAGKFLAFDAEL